MNALAHAFLGAVRKQRSGSLLALVLMLHVTALFSLVPFKRPFVSPVTPAAVAAAATHDTSTFARSTGQPGFTSLEARGLDSAVDQAVLHGTIEGTRQDYPGIGPAALGATLNLFRGLRVAASLPEVAGRQAWLPPLRRFNLRAPPAARA